MATTYYLCADWKSGNRIHPNITTNSLPAPGVWGDFKDSEFVPNPDGNFIGCFCGILRKDGSLCQEYEVRAHFGTGCVTFRIFEDKSQMEQFDRQGKISWEKYLHDVL
jgi:hypothetical protein